MMGSGEAQTRAPALDMVALLATRQQGMTQQLARDAQRLLSASGAQAYCLECPPQRLPAPREAKSGLVSLLGTWLRD